MKKITSSIALLALAGLSLTSCGTTGQSVLGNVGSALVQNALTGNGTTGQTTTNVAEEGTSLLGNLLSGILGQSATLSQSSLIGTWTYTGSDCVFESENLLAKAGGAVAANKLESQVNTQLAKIGIKEGSCTFTFNKDNTYTATIGGRTISGTYALDSKAKTIRLTYLAGLGTMTCHVAKTGNTLSLLMESSKLLTLAKAVSALSNSSSLKLASSLLSNYDGLYVGLKLKK